MAAIPIEELWQLESIESFPTGTEGHFPLTLNVVGMANGEQRKLNLAFTMESLDSFIEDLIMLYGIQMEVLTSKKATENEPTENGDQPNDKQ